MRILINVLVVLISTCAMGQVSESLVFEQKLFDFRDILESSGSAEHEFVFVNKSPKPVQIVSVNTSCGCTTPGWTKEMVASGKSGFVKVRFDPRGRPGYFSKTLSVTTNVDKAPIVLTIRGSVVTSQPELDYTVNKGSLSFTNGSFNVGKVYINKEPLSKSFTVKNKGNSSIQFVRTTSSADYITVITPEILEPGKEGEIRVVYDGHKRNVYGFYTDNIQIYTTDLQEPIKSFSVYATVEEFFPTLSAAELEKASALVFSSYSIELGTWKSDKEFERNLVFRNAGKNDLIIRSMQPNCDCFTAKAEHTTIKPDQTGNITVKFKYPGRVGTSQKALTIFSNDPKNPTQQIMLISVWEN